MLPHECVGIEIPQAFIHRRRSFEIREQEGYLADAEPFAFVDTLRSEQTPEGLSCKQCPAGHVWFEIQRRLDRLGDDLGRPIDQEERAALGSRVRHFDDGRPRWHCRERSREALPVVTDTQQCRRCRVGSPVTGTISPACV